MVSKATSTYVIMLTIFGGGLWAILSFGNVFLHAPTDLSGTWRLWTSADAAEPAHTMSVEQSGRFLRLELDQHLYDVKMTHDRQDATPTIELGGENGLAVSFEPPANGRADYAIHLAGPMQGTYLGTRADNRPKLPSTQPTEPNARS